MLFCQIEAILGGTDVEAIAAGTDLPSDPEVLQTVIESSQAEVANLLENIAEEERKMEQYQVSPLIFQLKPFNLLQRYNCISEKFRK